jgi:hypothetical protein
VRDNASIRPIRVLYTGAHHAPPNRLHEDFTILAGEEVGVEIRFYWRLVGKGSGVNKVIVFHRLYCTKDHASPL